MRFPAISCVVALLLAAPLLGACHSTRHGALPALDGRGAGLDAAVRAARIVYVGESHDDPEHHRLQLDVLRIAHDQAAADGAPVLLGMEMFQRPFQRHLDDYVARRIDEEEMLRRTQYYERWNMDYTLYAPLWRFCRDEGVRIVGLNVSRDIVRKIGRKGLDSLTAAERRQIAREIDLDVASHRKRILGVFSGGAHPMPPERLEALYEAQTTWDETMAESAVRALREAGPDARMVVVAGSYHVQEWDGIPDRVTRRMGEVPDLVVVARSVDQPSGASQEEAKLADFVVRTPAGGKRERPWLHGLKLAPEPDAAGVLVEDTRDGSPAALAGFEPLDVITDVEGVAVRDVTGLRYRLDHAAVGDTIAVRVLRDGLPTTVMVRLVPRPAPQARG